MKGRIGIAIFGMFLYSGVMAQSGAKTGYTLLVDISSMKPKPEKIIITYYDYQAGKRVSDSADILSDKVVFKGTLIEPVLAQINQYPPIPETVIGGNYIMSGKNGSGIIYYDGTRFFLEPGKTKLLVIDSIKNIKVKSSNTQKDYELLQAMKKPYNEKQIELQSKIAGYSKVKDTVNLKRTTAEIRAITTELKENVYKPYILKHANTSPVVLVALQEFADYGRANYNEFEAAFNSVAVQYQTLPSAIALKQRIFTNAFTAIGAIAPNFTQNDTLDKPVSLSAFRGKYVLLDFWASWCGPCRKENPNLVKSYNQFKDKGFTVLSVSLDQPGKKDAWLKAIHDDQLTWTHVSELTFWKNTAAKMYGVTGVPSNFLIDPQGKIIAKNLRGEELNKKLVEIFGK